MKRALLILSCLTMLVACDKTKKPSPSEATGSLKINFENYVGNEPLVLNSLSYQNSNGDSFEVSRYMYYVTALSLVKEDGTSFSREDLGFLVAQGSDNLHSFTNIPAGTYTKIRCTLGVDSIFNVSGAQDGILDPLHGMFWDWNTGYIMAKLEGKSPQSSGPANLLSFHLGGFSGDYSVVKHIELTLPNPLIISTETNPTLTFQSDVMKWFTGFPPIDFQTTHSTMEIGRFAYEMSERYKNHLKVSRVEN